MSLPLPSSAHKDAALTNMSIAYRNSMYVADRIFPTVPVKKQSDYYYVFPRSAWFTNEAGVRGPGSRANRGGYRLTDAQYGCKEYAFAHPIPVELITNADAVLTPMSTGVNFATEKILLAKEILAATLICTTANWSGNTEDAAGLWAATDSTNTFITDVMLRRETIRQAIGRYPNKLVMDAKTFQALQQASTILDRIKYGSGNADPAMVTAQIIAQLAMVDEVLVGGAIYSSDEETVASTEFTAVDIWETNAGKGGAALFYVPPTPSIETPSLGYTFTWNNLGIPDEIVAQTGARSVRRWWESAEKQWVVEASENLDMKMTSAYAGFYWSDTYAT